VWFWAPAAWRLAQSLPPRSLASGSCTVLEKVYLNVVYKFYKKSEDGFCPHFFSCDTSGSDTSMKKVWARAGERWTKQK
jgi:hypothetical protein